MNKNILFVFIKREKKRNKVECPKSRIFTPQQMP